MMNKSSLLLGSLMFVAGCLVCFISQPAQAQTSWKTPFSTSSWYLSANWTAGVPGSGSLAFIDNGGTAQIGAGSAVAGSLSVGGGSSGFVQMSSGGRLDVTNKIMLATVSGRNGQLNLFNANAFAAHTATFGENGRADVLITGNSTAEVNGAVSGFEPNTVLGKNETALGNLNVSGNNSRFNYRNLAIGGAGTGKVGIVSGGLIAGLTESESIIYLGYTNSGFGTLNVGEGAEPGLVRGTIVSHGKGVVIFNHYNTNYYFSDTGTAGGEAAIIFEDGLLINAHGRIAVKHTGSGKTTLFGVHHAYRGDTRIEAGTLRFASETVSLQSNILVGISGKGNVEIDSGCDVSNTLDVTVGVEAGGSGNLFVSGASSKLIARDIEVGGAGTGAVDVTYGGLLQTTSGGIGLLTSSSVGRVTISGSDSRWELAASSLVVGGAGKGTVEVKDTGLLSVGGGTGVLEVANLAGSTGSVHVTGSVPGVLEIGQINGGAGSAELVFNHVSPGYFFTKTGTVTGMPIVLSGNIDIHHDSIGTTTLKHSYTNSGFNSINSGTLNIDGSLGENVQTIVNAGTLGGTGILNGSVTVLSAGTINPGFSADTLTVNDNLDLQGTYTCDVDGDAYDMLMVTGVMAIGSGELNVRVSTNGLTQPVYKIARYGNLVGSFFSAVTKPGRYTINYNYQGSNIIALVDEPYVAWAISNGLDLAVNGGYFQDPNGDQRENFVHYSFDTLPVVGSQPFNRGIYVATDGGVLEYATHTLPIRDGAVFSGDPLTANVDGVLYAVTAAEEPEGVLLPVVQRATAITSGLPPIDPDYTYMSFRLDTNAADAVNGIIQIEARQDLE